MQTKSLDVEIKAPTDEEAQAGTFEAIVATWDVDSYGEQIVKGAFKDTLAEWSAKGAPIPVLWSHVSHDPDYHIGSVLEAKETDKGLWVKAQIDLEGPKGPQVYKLLKGQRVTQFSFAYDVLESAPVKSDGPGGEGTGSRVLELRKLKLYEVGPTLIGVNQATELLGVKAADITAALMCEAKAGRTLSSKNEEALRTAYESIGAVLGSLGNDESKARASEPVGDLISPDPMRSASVFSASERLALEALV